MRKFVTIALTSLLAFASVGASAAPGDDGTASVDVTTINGVISVSISDASFTAVPYSFETQTTSAVVDVEIGDTRGTGEGWNVTISGSDFQRDDSTGFGINNLVLAAPAVTSSAGQSSTSVAATGVTMDGSSAGQTIASASVRQGMGEYTLSHPATLTVPGGTLVGEYQSTLTVSIATAP